MLSRTRATTRAACAIAAGLLAVSGCSSTDADATASAPSSAKSTTYVTPRELPSGWGSGQDDGLFPRTITHAQGKTELEAAPTRVVVISTGQADALLTLGVVPVGSTAGDGADMIPAYLKTAFPQQAVALAKVAPLGSRLAPDIEAVANVKPDLILMNSAGKDATKLYTSLAAVAPTVVTKGTGLFWKQDFLLLGDALGKRQAAQTWLDTYQKDAADFGAGLGEKPTVSFLRKNGDRTRIFGVASFSGSVAEDSGLPRPDTQKFTDETSVNISSEQLEKADGDWLFYGVQGGDVAELTSAPLWKTLPAVAAKHAVEVDDDTFYLNTGPTAARLILAQLERTLG